jgi:hypothetical protein
MKSIGTRRLVLLPNGLAITLLTCVLTSLIPSLALATGNLHHSTPRLRFVFARTAKKVNSGNNPMVQKPDESRTLKTQNVTDQDLRKHIADADLVIVGKVVEVRAMVEPTERRPISEHDPQWQEAVVEVETVLKGSVSLKSMTILFPGTLDVAWFGVPRFRFDHQGIWIVKKDRYTKAFAVLDPLDFVPKNQFDRVKQLIKTQPNVVHDR